MGSERLIEIVGVSVRVGTKMRSKSATTSRAGGMRMAPGRGRSHLCWWPLIFKNFLISIISVLLVLMTT